MGEIYHHLYLNPNYKVKIIYESEKVYFILKVNRGCNFSWLIIFIIGILYVSYLINEELGYLYLLKIQPMLPS